jgi:hypothetical protein
MTEQPKDRAPEPEDTGADGRTRPFVPDHVRTAGETDVDDAIGASDDPS